MIKKTKRIFRLDPNDRKIMPHQEPMVNMHPSTLMPKPCDYNEFNLIDP